MQTPGVSSELRLLAADAIRQIDSSRKPPAAGIALHALMRDAERNARLFALSNPEDTIIDARLSDARPGTHVMATISDAAIATALYVRRRGAMRERQRSATPLLPAHACARCRLPRHHKKRCAKTIISGASAQITMRSSRQTRLR